MKGIFEYLLLTVMLKRLPLICLQSFLDYTTKSKDRVLCGPKMNWAELGLEEECCDSTASLRDISGPD